MRPVELYRFTLRQQTWTYANAEVPFTLSGQVYAPETIERTGIDYTMSQPRQAIDVTVRRDFPVASLFAAGVQPGVVNLVVLEIDRSTPTVSRLVWRGRVLGPEWIKDGEGLVCRLKCEPRSTQLGRGVLKLRTSVACNKQLYGITCRADRNAYRVTATATAVSGHVITAQAFGELPDGWLAGGWLELANVPRRMILSHTGGSVVLSGPVPGLNVGSSLVVFPGCDHLPDTCATKFENIENYGGKLFVPGRDPHREGVS